MFEVLVPLVVGHRGARQVKGEERRQVVDHTALEIVILLYRGPLFFKHRRAAQVVEIYSFVAEYRLRRAVGCFRLQLAEQRI